MPSFSTSTTVLTVAIVLVLLASPAHAFGAGNIASVAKIEGLNWRHGDIEDTLLTLVMARAAGGKKFDKMNVARVYFGNWLRDYSQAIDVGTVKYVSAEAIRILLWVLGFMTFGFGTKEFEVTTERLGCYRPEDHIDNPKDYADNIDASQYDRRLRGPVDERVELAIDPNTGMKNYIANERAGIMTSALHVRKLFAESIRLGRSYGRSNNKAELYEALRLLGTGLHCLEDYSAHSNYTELALIEMGERDVFPHVGRRTKMRLQGARDEVYPIITGTFGGVDFLHSVMGEIGDKATQSEIEELEGTMKTDSRADTSVIRDLLDKIPDGIFGGKDEAGKADELKQNAVTAQMNQTRVSPRDPEAFTIQMQEIVRQIYPIIEWHDEVMLSITEAIEKIPILPDLIEQFEGEVNKLVFSLLAPFVLPIISQIKTELNTGSSEVIASSKDKQLIVFNDDRSTDPTHSMLSKDHFSNVLNEPAGKIASQVLKWVVPQLMAAWDDTNVDVNRTIDRIVNGVFHHPAQRDMGDDGAADGRRLMFGVVEKWWGEQDRNYQRQLRQKLSREGVENGENHKEGVHDSGHGCGQPLGMHKTGGKGAGAAGGAVGAIMGGLSDAIDGGKNSSSGGKSSNSGGNHNEEIGKFASQAAGGGALGGIVGALAGGLGGSLLSGAFGGEDKKTSTSSGYTSGGGYQQQYTEEAHSGNKYGQAQYSETDYPGGRQKTDYQRYEQSGNQGSGFEQHTETKQTYGGGYEQTNERIYQQGGNVQTESWNEGRTSEGKRYSGEHHKRQGSGERRQSRERRKSNDSGNGYKKEKKYKKKHDSESGSEDGGYKKKDKYKKSSDDEYKKKDKKKKKKYADKDSDSDESPKRHGGNEYGGGREESGYGGGRQEQGGYGGGREERGSGGREEGGYGGGRQEYGGGREEGGYGGGRQEYGGGGRQESGGREEGGYGGGRQEGGYGGGRQEQGGYGGGRQEQGGYGGGREERGSGGREEGGYGGGRQEYGQNVPGGFGGNEAGWGQEERQEERQDNQYGERRQERREEGGGGWFN